MLVLHPLFRHWNGWVHAEMSSEPPASNSAPPAPTGRLAGLFLAFMEQYRSPPAGPRLATGLWFASGGLVELLLIGRYFHQPFHDWYIFGVGGFGGCGFGWGFGMLMDYMLVYTTAGYLLDAKVVDWAESDTSKRDRKKADLWKQLTTRREQLSRRRPPRSSPLP